MVRLRKYVVSERADSPAPNAIVAPGRRGQASGPDCLSIDMACTSVGLPREVGSELSCRIGVVHQKKASQHVERLGELALCNKQYSIVMRCRVMEWSNENQHVKSEESVCWSSTVPDADHLCARLSGFW